jgi:hypothetical protein
MSEDAAREVDPPELVNDIQQSAMHEVASIIARRGMLLNNSEDQMELIIKTAIMTVLMYYKTCYFNLDEAVRDKELDPVEVAKNFHDDLLTNLNALEKRLRIGAELE